MVITQKKPIEEVMQMVGTAQRVAIVGCSSCATACQTGGEEQVAELKKVLENAGKTVVATAMCDFCCNNTGVKRNMKAVIAAAPECVICMSCGDGVQCVAKNMGSVPTYPSNNTMYLGETVRYGLWEEACRFCGQCVLGQTGAICPITHCAKSLVNGPCGGQRNGNCEIHPDKPCAWIRIYERLKETDQLEKLTQIRPDKDYAGVAYPRTIRLGGDKK